MSEPRPHPTGPARLAAWLAPGLGPWLAPPLAPTALVAAAARSGGGDPSALADVQAPLQALCADLEAHPPSPLGRVLIALSLVDALSARLRWAAVPPPPPPSVGAPPVVIVGWYRTGTSLLQALLAALPGRTFVPLHRLASPAPRRGSAARVGLATAALHQLAPALRHLHPVSAHGPEEDWLLLAHHLVVEGYALHWRAPRYLAWLQACDRRPAYRHWAAVTQGLAAELGATLILKDPAHLLALPELRAAAPGARLVRTWRDPVEVVPSLAALTCAQHELCYGVHDPERAGRVALARTRRGLAAGAHAWAQVPAAQRAEVAHARLVADPVGVVAELCRHLDLPQDDDAIARRARQLGVGAHRARRRDPGRWGLRATELAALTPPPA